MDSLGVYWQQHFFCGKNGTAGDSHLSHYYHTVTVQISEGTGGGGLVPTTRRPLLFASNRVL